MHFGPLIKKPNKPQPPTEIKKATNTIFPSQYVAPPNVYMNYTNQQHIPPNYPMQIPPSERHPISSNMINPQFKNYPPMHSMMMKPQNQRPPPQPYPPNPQAHPFMHPGQMPPAQMNPNMNPMMPPNMIAPPGQNLPPQVAAMNNANYQQQLSLRRSSTGENPHIKAEPTISHDPQSQLASLNMRKKVQSMVPNPQATLHYPSIQNLPQNNINPLNSPGNASPSNSQSQLVGSNTKDQNNSKSKPSELSTLGLKINNHVLTGYDIVTKIFFGKKQIVWELVETGHGGEKKDSQSLETPSKEKDDETGNDGNEENNGNDNFKKKFDIKFSDIEAVEVNVEKNTMTIDTKTSPVESKVLSQQHKKTVPWVKHTGLLKTADGKPIFEADKPTKIVVHFQKDLLTRKNSSKNSHLDKIKACQLNLTIVGQIPENITPKNKPSMSPTVSMTNEQKLEEFNSLNNASSRYMMNSNAGSAPYEDRHLDQNPQIISLPMYNAQNMNKQNVVGQFSDKNVKAEPIGALSEKRDEDYDNDEGELFPALTKEKIVEIKRFEQDIKTKSDEDKINLAINSLKIKRHPISLCPYYKCYKNLNNPHSLKSHIVKKHPRLIEMGLNVNVQSETKIFDWNSQMIDNALILAKTFPKFTKNMIREMKKTKNSNY